jgi:hypothetical protein
MANHGLDDAGVFDIRIRGKGSARDYGNPETNRKVSTGVNFCIRGC